MCRSKNVNAVQHEESDSDAEENHIVWVIDNAVVDVVDWSELIRFKGGAVNMKIDTGSQVNILNIRDFTKLGLDSRCLVRSSAVLTSYTGHRIEVMGQFICAATCNNKTIDLPVHVLSAKTQKSILGLDAAEKFGLVQTKSYKDFTINQINTPPSINNILKQYVSVFSGLGRVSKEFNITLKEGAIPQVFAARKVPVALKEKVKEQLDNLVEDSVLVPIEEPTDWVHPIVVTTKANGDVRICMDPRALNKYIKRENFHIPTTDSLFVELAGAQYFTLLDASQAFLQIPLTEDSSKLCTIATRWGRYRYLRLPYGLSAAPEIFQRFMSETLEGLRGVIVYIDDVLIFGNTIDIHNVNLQSVLERIQASGLKLNLEKSKICKQVIKFLGHEISANGIATDINKTIAIKGMGTPQCKKDLQRFLGMIVYLAKFIPNLSQETAPLRKLLSDKVEWLWGQNEERCFEKLKELVSTTPILKFFDSQKATTVSVDASPYGLGVVLLQDDQPIEYASASLTPTQQRYNHIEKEMLALVYGCERFHFYLYGNRFNLHTDHRPLLGLIKKPFDELSPRLQRMAIRLLRYDFVLEYVPGKKSG